MSTKAKKSLRGDSNTEPLAAALEYGAEGLRVFPCLNKPGDPEHKKPLTKHGFKDASCDPKVMTAWWKRWPNALIGMPTGKSFCVLDLDVKKGKNGLAVIPDWEKRSPLIAGTGSGGRHLYFLPDEQVRCTTDQIGLGVDTRGKGGYVIVPPSEGYLWVNGHDLSDLSLLPPWPDDLRLPVDNDPHESGEELLARDLEEFAFALSVIPNDIREYSEWKKICMAIWAATNGSEEGFELCDEFSQRWTCGTYDAAEVKKAWQQISDSPPDKISAGTIFYLADQADPGWRARIKGKKSLDDGLSKEQKKEIARLAALSLVQYEKERAAAAERLGLRKSVLDQLVYGARPNDPDDRQGTELEFTAIKPWPEAVEGERLVADLVTTIRNHVILTEHQALTTAVWVMHVHALEYAEHSPRLHIASPVKRCGKTTLLSTVAALVPKPISTENITTSAVFRMMEMHQPTLLIDEADIFLNDNEDMRSLLNSGHGRRGTCIRTVGEDFEPRAFKVWSAVVIAGIGDIPATLEDRSITILLRRRLPDEQITRLRSNRTEHLAVLARRAARWVADHKIALADADPELPEKLSDREHDNWRPLVAIADAISGKLGQRVREAALAISLEKPDEDLENKETWPLMVLADVAAIVELYLSQKKTDKSPSWMLSQKKIDKIPSWVLCNALNELVERPWSEYHRRGQFTSGLTMNALARLLKPFKIRPQAMRFEPKPAPTRNGYFVDQILEAKRRYIDKEVTLTNDDIGDFSSFAGKPDSNPKPRNPPMKPNTSRKSIRNPGFGLKKAKVQ
jgi:hypothetical protein